MAGLKAARARGKSFVDQYYTAMSAGISLKELGVMLIVAVGVGGGSGGDSGGDSSLASAMGDSGGGSAPAMAPETAMYFERLAGKTRVSALLCPLPSFT